MRSEWSVATQVDADDYACEAEIVIPLDTPTLLMQEITERVAVGTMIRDTPGKLKHDLKMIWDKFGKLRYSFYIVRDTPGKLRYSFWYG